MSSSWNLVDEYSPEVIHVRASDQDGHSWKGRIQLPKGWPGWIEAIIEDPRFPEYRTTADFIRDAVFHRLHYWADNPDRPVTGDLPNRLSLERMKNRLASSRDFSHEVASFKGELDETCSALHRARDYTGLLRLVNECEDEVRANFSEPYLSDVLDRISYWRKAGGA